MNHLLRARRKLSRTTACLVLLATTLALPGCSLVPVPVAVPTRAPTVPVIRSTRPLTVTPLPPSVTQAPTTLATRQPTALLPATLAVPGFDLAALQEVMLTAINADRAAAGLNPVAWDATAAQAGLAHAADMLATEYFSHWNLQGLGPEHRYALAGGRDAVAENLYTFWYRYEDGRAAPIDDWPRVIRESQASLMQSPGHRRTILDPAHTHVGIGIAYDPQRGEMRLAQEFVTRLVDMAALPIEARSGDVMTVRGTLGATATDPLINLAYMPLPAPFTTETVPQGTYTSRAEIIEAIQPQLDGRQFGAEVRLGQANTPGIYAIRIWVRQGDDMALASELVVYAR